MKSQEFLKSCVKNATFSPIHLQNKELAFMEVNERRNTVRCIRRNTNDEEPFSVRTSAPLQENQCAGYFEVTIVNMTREQYQFRVMFRGIAIGLCRKDCSIKKPPGTSKWSIGLQSSGSVFSDKVKMCTLAPFSKGDTIGCGIIYDTLEVFFTRGGIIQQKPLIKLQQTFTEYYPTASLHCESQQLQFNFGEKPFKFDFISYLNKLRTQRMQHISTHYKVDAANMYDLVEDYLYFHGFAETLEKFQKIRTGREGNQGRQKYLLVDPAGKDVLGLDQEGIGNLPEEEHKTEKEDDQCMMLEEDMLGSPPAMRHRFMSESIDPFPSLSLPRKESYDAQVIALVRRKQSVPHSIEDISMLMEVEDEPKQVTDKPKVELKAYGPLTKRFLDEDRIKILKLARAMQIEQCIKQINRTIPKLLTASKLLPYYLNSHIYLRMIKEGKNYKAIDFARQKKLDAYRSHPFPKYQPNKGQITDIKFQDMISAIIFKQTYDKSLLSQQQFYSLAEILNAEIMRYLGLFDKSKLELMLAQIRCVEERYEKERHNGDRICLFN